MQVYNVKSNLIRALGHTYTGRDMVAKSDINSHKNL